MTFDNVVIIQFNSFDCKINVAEMDEMRKAKCLR